MSGKYSPYKDAASIDLIFTVLTKHEEALDKVARRLEDIADAIVTAKEPPSRTRVESRSLFVEVLEDWKEFKERSSAATHFFYDVSTAFSIRALLPNGRLLKYVEQFLKTDKAVYRSIAASKLAGSNASHRDRILKLECGLEYSIKFNATNSLQGGLTEGVTISLDAKKVKEWLQSHMDVDETKVSHGVIVI